MKQPDTVQKKEPLLTLCLWLLIILWLACMGSFALLPYLLPDL
ncbi:hypothetical protein EI42_01685 [Thermosporothrix hazakensis]|jgi:hypothetical protein|uniref:Uncharacterized protein n=2 Tax=Thermosporothrix TaxID=768650 RepID=A0A326UJ98_THEHA|nr:hypothetical protein [Thermosporothrix hazakensis]PZW32593.1 hypothetical protein EI42_01685 [Thermosporothrix hazakensis]BBH87496.1 hypothetical protein KTC_22470 [Thermosporothrix sp. COM3]GCE49947.1 hypothetical protein KTH_48160 [Thermosporothrix hazakensis]